MPVRKLRLLSVEDNALSREGMAALLDQQSDPAISIQPFQVRVSDEALTDAAFQSL